MTTQRTLHLDTNVNGTWDLLDTAMDPDRGDDELVAPERGDLHRADLDEAVNAAIAQGHRVTVRARKARELRATGKIALAGVTEV